MQQNRGSLGGLRVLVAEDEALIAMEIEVMLRDLQCEIIGPVSTVEAAVAAVCQSHDLEGALLDLNLHGETVLPAAEELLRRAVPFLLVTGYAPRNGEPPALRDAPRLQKPLSLPGLTDAMMETFLRRSAEP